MSDETSSQNLKVTDRRMFTPDGDLREEYRFLEQSRAGAAAPEAASSASPGDEPVAASAEAPATSPRGASDPRSEALDAAAAEAPGPALELPVAATPSAGFFDLVAMLAEPASIYLGDIQLPDGSTQEDLEMARLHIDMLDLLRLKTVGNLSSQESTVLEDVVYQLKTRYVRKQG